MVAALKSVPLFAGLEEQQLKRLAQRAVPRRAETGTLLFAEGDDCQGLYVIFSGALKIFKQSAQGREQVLAVERSGGVVAELPVFDGGPYPASCQPTESSVVIFISKQDFRPRYHRPCNANTLLLARRQVLRKQPLLRQQPDSGKRRTHPPCDVFFTHSADPQRQRNVFINVTMCKQMMVLKHRTQILPVVRQALGRYLRHIYPVHQYLSARDLI